MICPLCRVRKAKRACPGTGQQICAVCCGTKRIVEIACPPTCMYLTTAQKHPAAVVKRQTEQDLVVLMGALGRVSEPQLQVFFVIHTFISRFRHDGSGQLVDADVAEAAGALAASFETAAKGVLYEHQATAAAAESLRRELKLFLAQIAGDPSSGGAASATRFEREVAVVLRGIERGARHDAPGWAAAPSITCRWWRESCTSGRPTPHHGRRSSFHRPWARVPDTRGRTGRTLGHSSWQR